MLLWDFIKTDLHHRYFPRNCPTFFAIFICLVSQIITVLRGLLTKVLIVFHVETTRKQPFPRRFNVDTCGAFVGLRKRNCQLSLVKSYKTRKETESFAKSCSSKKLF